MQAERQLQSLPPVYDGNSRILILGSFPSVKSRETAFYYGNPQNRFWQVMAAVLACGVPETVEEKRAMLLAHGVALWDVAASCTIAGSRDDSIADVRPNDVAGLLCAAPIQSIFTNGNKAFSLYCRHLAGSLGREAALLPSTSPANAAWPLKRLAAVWASALCPFLLENDKGETP